MGSNKISCGILREAICLLCKLGYDNKEIDGRYKTLLNMNSIKLR
jgi:hypothetical protein